jgi:dsRNA-specific ribonuclease
VVTRGQGPSRKAAEQMAAEAALAALEKQNTRRQGQEGA